jgi:hypothetical protein
MRIAFLMAAFSFLAIFSASAQAPAAASPQALLILQKALFALSPNITTRDITLSGSVRSIAGSDDETGTATLKAIATGATQIELSLPSGSRSDVRNLTVDPPPGYWSGPDGVRHDLAYHNLLGEPAWFAPAPAIVHAMASPNTVATYVGAETLDSQSVQHISVSQRPPASAFAPDIVPHLTQFDLYVDSSTFLPPAMSFNVHPDSDALVDIPMEVRFSDYRAVNGTQVPFHVQQFLNNGLTLDLQFQRLANV